MISEISKKHISEISQAKKKQWCKLCEQRAIYRCCWNTNYCSRICQETDWKVHKFNCSRKKGNETANETPKLPTESDIGK